MKYNNILVTGRNRNIITAVSVLVVTVAVLAWYNRRRSNKRTTSDVDEEETLEGRLRRKAEEEAVKDSPNGAEFLECSRRIRKIPASETSSGEKLVLYGLYKQVMDGNAPTNQQKGFQLPGYNIMEAHAKHTAWLNLSGMSRDEAIARYVAAARDIENRIASGGVDTSDDDAMVGGLAPQVSRPSAVEDGGDNDDDVDDTSKENSLFKAAGENDAELVKKLVQEDGVFVNHTDRSGQTALHLAADKGCRECVDVLVNVLGANVNAADNDGISVLQAAVIAGTDVKICQILLQAGANPDQPDNDGDTPRTCATDDDGSNAEQLQELFTGY